MSDLYVGQMLYGFCGGYFGRDSHDNKRIEAIGNDWLVVREEDGTPNFVYFSSHKDMVEVLLEYTTKEDEDGKT